MLLLLLYFTVSNLFRVATVFPTAGATGTPGKTGATGGTGWIDGERAATTQAAKTTPRNTRTGMVSVTSTTEWIAARTATSTERGHAPTTYAPTCIGTPGEID